MANPQLENGYIRIANKIWQELRKIRIPGEAMQILMVIIEETYGWSKKEAMIKNKTFVEKTGINKQNVNRAISKLIGINIIKVIKKDYNVAPTYCFNKDYDTWLKVIKKDYSNQKGLHVLSKKITPTTSEPFSDNGSDDPKDIIKDNVLTKVSSKPQIPEKKNAPEIIKYFCELYKHYFEIEYLPTWQRDTGIINRLWIKIGINIFDLIDHYLSIEENPKQYWTTQDRTIKSFSYFINEVQQHMKEYA
jgi:phage replication O-like protein O